MSYRDLEIWQLARKSSVEVHTMTLSALPRFEMHETGSQIRRSVKSIRANIVEGYGRRRYKAEFVKFLTYALGSCDETTDHLLTLYETKSLHDEPLYLHLNTQLDTLGRKLNLFRQAVERAHRSDK